MTNISVIENKVSLIKKYLKILQRYQKYSKKEIVKNVDIRGATERYLYLVVQATIDLAGAIISFKNLRKPTTMSENFYILNEEKIINSDLAEMLIKMTGFRNVIVHDYEEINYDIIYDVLKNRLKDIEKFLKIVEGMCISQ